MKTLQLIFGTLLLSLVFGSSVFAQDAMRADEYRITQNLSESKESKKSSLKNLSTTDTLTEGLITYKK